MIEVQGLRKAFGAKVAVNDVSFSVPKGQVLGFLGPNGAGKTTTMRILTSFLMPDGGTATIAGKDVVRESKETRERIGYMAEGAPFYADMRVYDYLRFTAQIRKISRNEARKRMDRAIDVCGLKPVLMNAFGELSRGFRQRMGLAQAIMHDPGVLILDEPTSGLDPNQIVEIRSLIKQLGEEKTVLLSTHIMQEVQAICGRVLIIADGQLVADGSPDELQRRARSTDLVITQLRGTLDDIVQQLNRLDGVEAVNHKETVPGEGRDDLHTFEVDVQRDREVCEAIFDLATAQNWKLAELRRERVSLEDVFARVTSGESLEN